MPNFPPRPPVGSWEAIDRHALAIPASSARSVEALAGHLSAGARGEAERARAIYRWLAANIRYDPGSLGGRWRDAAHLAETVLRRRVGVCDGFAVLCDELARHAALEARIVTGVAKGVGYEAPGRAGRQPNHAWNALRLQGRWHLLDAAWGSGYLDVGRRRFVQRFTDVYFLPPPEALIYSHFPEDPAWQLVQPPLDFAAFAALPLVKPAYFRDGLRLASHAHGTVAVDGEAEIRLNVPTDTELLVRLQQGVRSFEDARVGVERCGDTAIVRVSAPQPGRYALRLFTRPQGSQEPFDWALEYDLVARRAGRRRYVRTSPVAAGEGLAVDLPPEGLVADGGEVVFGVGAPAGLHLHATLEQGGRVVPGRRTFVQPAVGGWEVRARLPGAGDYLLRLYTRQGGPNGTFDWSVDVPLRGRRAPSGTGAFPERYAGFVELRAILEDSWSGTLHAGRPQRFLLRVPGAERVAAVQGGEWHALAREGERFEGVVVPRPGELVVYAAIPGRKGYAGLLRYTVR